MADARRQAVSDRALLFGSNSMYAVLLELARRGRRRRGDAKEPLEFHGAELGTTGFTRTQIQRELSKLRTLGIIERAGKVGKAERLTVPNSDLARALLRLVTLIDRAEIPADRDEDL